MPVEIRLPEELHTERERTLYVVARALTAYNRADWDRLVPEEKHAKLMRADEFIAFLDLLGYKVVPKD